MSTTDKCGRGDRSAESSAHYARHRNERLAYQKKRRTEHPEEVAASKKLDLQRHRVAGLAKQAEWRAANQAVIVAYRITHREETSERNRLYAQGHSARISSIRKARDAANPEMILARRRRYCKSPSGRASIANSRHRRRAASNGTVTAAQLLVLRAMASGCFYCNAKNRPLTYDHFIPLNGIRGTNPPIKGPHAVENIVMACLPCNSSKKDRDPHEFIASLKIAA